MLGPLSRSEIRTLRSLTSRSVRLRRGAFLLEGSRAIESALEFPDRVQLIAISEDVAGTTSAMRIAERAEKSGIRVRLIDRKHLQEIADSHGEEVRVDGRLHKRHEPGQALYHSLNNWFVG